MKKFISILLVLMMLLAFTACDDGKCDTCDEPAVENETGVEVDGEYCQVHLLEEVGKVAAENAKEALGDILG